MNNSDRTTIIAKGISLWADVQNLTGSDVSPEAQAMRRRWDEWAERWSNYVEFVKREQFALFDRVNAKF